MKCNILQYQPPTKLMNTKDKTNVNVDPAELRKASIRFTLSDGMLNSEKLASLDVAGTVIQAATQLPQVAQEYDVMGIINYVWDLQGIHWLQDFKRDATAKAQYLQEVAAQTTAEGQMPPGPPPGPADAGARGALQ